MVKRYKIIILTILLLCIVSFSNVIIKSTKAWGPVSHMMLISKSLERAKEINVDSEILRIIYGNIKWFWCGYNFPDVTVILYYTEFKSYHDTHKLLFYEQLWNLATSLNSENAKAFTIGVGTHLLQDSIIHNYYIPRKIRETFVQNNIIHPVTEALIESKYISMNATAQAIAANAFTVWRVPMDDCKIIDETGTERYLTPAEFVKEATGIDYTTQAQIFEQILSEGNFYSEKGYWVPGGAEGYWGLYKAFANFLKDFLPIEDYEQFAEETISVTAKWFAEGTPDPDSLATYMNQLDATGIDALMEADRFVVNWAITAIVGFIIIVIIFYRWRRS